MSSCRALWRGSQTVTALDVIFRHSLVLALVLLLRHIFLDFLYFFFLMIRRPPISTLFPYPTLSGSEVVALEQVLARAHAGSPSLSIDRFLPSSTLRSHGRWHASRWASGTGATSGGRSVGHGPKA